MNTSSSTTGSAGETCRRIGALVEVLLVFAFTHVAYRALKNFTVIGQCDATTNFIPGAVMIGVTLLVLCWVRTDKHRSRLVAGPLLC